MICDRAGKFLLLLLSILYFTYYKINVKLWIDEKSFIDGHISLAQLLK